MIQLRVGHSEVRFPERNWEAWVSEGRVPPDALVFSMRLTGGLWKRADSLELYQFFRRTGEEDRREAALSLDPRSPFAELPAVVFPRKGFSATELLLGLNLAVALILVLVWRGDYTEHIFGTSALSHGRGEGLAWDLYALLVDRHLPIGLVATLFIHADLRHLMANMMTLVPAAAYVEYLYGRRVCLVYLVGGVAGAITSYLAKGHGPMSVGASGAIYALIGVIGGFLVRHYRHMPRWHRWRTRRIYMPLLAIAVLPSIFNADWRAHVGGFLCGLLLGVVLRLGKRGRGFLLPAARD
ncbi:MAG: rhomboid family intramembrane serine protease [Candidatus Eisenbacteria sp.]|nr:rhomboid family intramembrane serine protease [Candidatus Eisenbacteria bacterium]